MSQSTKVVTSNVPHASLAIALTVGLILAAVIPATSQTMTFGDPVETDFAPYKLGQAGDDIFTVYDVRTEPQGQVTKSDTIKFHVGGLVENYGQAEYKLTLKPGQTVHYSWTASDEIYYEFHGHYMIDTKTPGDAVLYRNAKAAASHGSVTAPIEGWHGWYFVNDSFDTPIDIELTIWGDYEMTPGVINTRQ